MDTIASVALIVTSQFGYIVSYQENLERLEMEVVRLEDTIASVQHSTYEAERNGEMIEVSVQVWLKRVEYTAVEAKKLVEGREETGCCMGLLPNLWKRSQLNKRFEEMTQEISQLIANGKFDTISYRVASEMTTTPFGRGIEALDSRTSILNEMKESLKDPKMYMIGVYGMGGIGKTTLIKELAWQVKKDASFAVVAIAIVTSYPDVEKIQDQIAETMGRKLECTTKLGRADELRQIIKHEKSVLIILDDIWSEFDLTEVGIPFGGDHDGCNIVMTSRDLKVLQMMGSQKEFNLRVLSENDSWNLFQKMAGDVVKEFNIKPIAEKVAKCCAGLPLLIVTMAKGLRKKDVTFWRDALYKLENFGHEELKNGAYRSVEMSYNYLENDELKSLFLLIGSFGLNGIRTEDLFSCCWGLGFYENMHTLADARNRHYKLIDDLRAFSLLLEGEPEWVRMHDVVLNVAKSIASTCGLTCAVQRFSNMNEWSKLDQLQECPELKLLLLENTGDYDLDVPDNSFSGMREVRTLSLYGMSFTPYPPPSLNHLKNLRTLNLYGCKLGDIRMVAELKYLEILNLEKSSIQELPKEIGHLILLRLLNLANCSKLRFIPANLISSLSRLEELYMRNCYIEWQVEGSKSESNNASLRELQNLHELTTLDISILDSSVWRRDDKPQVVSHFQNLTCLKVHGCHSLTSLFSSWVGRALVKLQHLEISLCSMLKEIFVQEEEVQFPNLETLHISDMSDLESIWPNQVVLNSFCELKQISIRKCESLGYVFPITVAKKLWQLQDLEINQCAIRNIVEESDTSDITHVYLQKLRVTQCHNMKTIVPSSVLFNTLDELAVSWCDGVVNIITPSISTTCLPKLRILKVSGCHQLEEIYGSGNYSDALLEMGEIAFMQLEELTFSDLSRLTSFCQGSYDFRFPSLQKVELRECPMMETFCYGNLITPSYTKVRYL